MTLAVIMIKQARVEYGLKEKSVEFWVLKG